MKKINIKETDVLVRFLASETNDAEKKIVQNWLNESQENKDFFEQLKTLWNDSDNHEFLNKKYYTDESWDKILSHIQKTKKSSAPFKRSLIRIAVAASILLLAGTGIIFYLLNNKEISVKSKGEVAKVYLQDKSIVWLNRDSKLIYKKNFKKQRIVELYGEGYFDVKPDSAHPFIIITSNAKITVLGTKFNVNAYPDDSVTEVTVTTGKVKVTALEDSKKHDGNIVILPGEKSITAGISNLPQKALSDNPNYMSWKTRDFVFNNTNIREIVQLVNKIYNANISIQNSSSAETCNLTGKYSCHTLNDMLDMLRIVLNISIEKDGDNIILNTSGC